MNKEEEAKTLLKQGWDVESVARKTGVSREWLEGQRRWM